MPAEIWKKRFQHKLCRGWSLINSSFTSATAAQNANMIDPMGLQSSNPFIRSEVCDGEVLLDHNFETCGESKCLQLRVAKDKAM